jgi:hypothetical protein
MSGDAPAQNAALGITKSVQCPPSTIGVKMKDCLSNDAGTYFAYDMEQPNHKNALKGGTEQFMLKFFGTATT